MEGGGKWKGEGRIDGIGAERLHAWLTENLRRQEQGGRVRGGEGGLREEEGERGKGKGGRRRGLTFLKLALDVEISKMWLSLK